MVLMLAACDNDLSPGQVLPEGVRGIPEWVAPNFVVDKRSARDPVFGKKEITFQIRPGDCSKHRDVTGPSDCATRTSRSVLKTGDTWWLGRQYINSFEFWIDPALTHQGYRNGRAPGGRNSRLAIARWQGEGQRNAQLFDLKVDARRGVTFLGETCIPTREFGKWHRFDLRVKWADDGTGYIEARCHGDLYQGAPIYAVSGVDTNKAPVCLRQDRCIHTKGSAPDRFSWQIGILHEAEVVNGRRVFPRVPQQGLVVKMRRVVERQLFVVFGRVDEL